MRPPRPDGPGIALGALAVRRHRWPAVVLLAADARIVLDPSVYTYYTASVLLGTLIWDSIGQRRLVPWVSWVALISLYGNALLVPSDSAQGFIRLAFAVGSAAYVLWWPQRTPRGRRRGRRAQSRPPSPSDGDAVEVPHQRAETPLMETT
ncbi:hypothetical protein [Streptomyces sp. NPDC001816]|uniref:hypothetical protein n=1 Tax=Streptomyces sp. NPDC001816 TaxID=3364612 RepID=UPI0036771440